MQKSIFYRHYELYDELFGLCYGPWGATFAWGQLCGAPNHCLPQCAQNAREIIYKCCEIRRFERDTSGLGMHAALVPEYMRERLHELFKEHLDVDLILSELDSLRAVPHSVFKRLKFRLQGIVGHESGLAMIMRDESAYWRSNPGTRPYPPINCQCGQYEKIPGAMAKLKEYYRAAAAENERRAMIDLQREAKANCWTIENMAEVFGWGRSKWFNKKKLHGIEY